MNLTTITPVSDIDCILALNEFDVPLVIEDLLVFGFAFLDPLLVYVLVVLLKVKSPLSVLSVDVSPVVDAVAVEVVEVEGLVLLVVAAVTVKVNE